MAAFVAKQMLGSKMNAVKGKIVFIFFGTNLAPYIVLHKATPHVIIRLCALSFPSVGLSSFCSPSKAYLFDSPSGPCHDSADLRLSIAGRRGPVDSIQKLFPFICDGVL